MYRTIFFRDFYTPWYSVKLRGEKVKTGSLLTENEGRKGYNEIFV
jgi:hypothetical protein